MRPPGQVRKSGVERLAIVNGHGGNYVLANIVQQANVGGARMTLFPGRTEWDVAGTAARLQAAAGEDMHAGDLEVSLLLHAYPELVGDDFRHEDWQAAPRPQLLVTGMRGYTESEMHMAASNTAEYLEHLRDAYTYKVNAALERGRDDLAAELADDYLDEVRRALEDISPPQG